MKVTARSLAHPAKASLSHLDREKFLPMGWAGVYLEGMQTGVG